MFRYYMEVPAFQLARAWNWVVMKGQHLHIPNVRRFSIDYSLPKLPVPPLDQTLKKYLDTCHPLLNEEQYKSTEEIVAKFLKNEGPVLQTLLEERALKEVNWLSDWWKHYAYLDVRMPVVINVNPGIYLPKQSYSGQREQIEFAARFIAGVLDYKIMLDEQSVPVETLGGRPLCMTQNYQLLNACRIPGVRRDTHVCIEPGDPRQPKHIIVIHNNHLFSVDVYGDQGKPLSVSQLSQQLDNCVNLSKEPGAPVGILTSMDRTTWGKVYAGMLNDKTNKACLESIQSSMFAVCLDGPQPETDGDPIELATSIVLHGGGSQAYSANRWFDKTMQFILSQDGYIGLNYEHTAAEASAVINLIDHVLGFLEKKKEPSMAAQTIHPPKQLCFNISSKTQEIIDRGLEEIDSAVNDLMLRVLFFKDYGKDFIKKHKLSPDALIQMAFQLAYYRIYKQPCATYESGSLRRYHLGRTDTIRSCSTASVAFTKGMDDESLPHNRKVDLLKEAVKSHKKYTDDTVNGKGIDRHLLGLKLVALENNMNIPELFMDLAFKESTHFRLSTSQVASRYRAFLCFGPVVPDGYGLCYNPQNEELIVSISSFNNNPQTDSDTFLASLSNSLQDIQTLLTNHSQAK
ncbi:hypothetical protein BsWGS_09009 [Bradybaena similaris]